MPSAFIVFEGPDGSGTTLHARLLREQLESQGVTVISTFEPTDGPIGMKIRETLHSGEPLSPASLQELFCSDRAWHLEHVIKPALKEGSVVISDRYLHSTLAYGQALGLDANWLKDMNKNFIQPDHVFFLLPPYEICAERMGRREKHDALEKPDLQRKVYDAYKQLAQEDPSVHVIDTSETKTDVSDEIFAIAKDAIIK